MPLGATPVPGSSRGDLVVIGGAEDKLGKRAVLADFVRRAGGEQARIAAGCGRSATSSTGSARA